MSKHQKGKPKKSAPRNHIIVALLQRAGPGGGVHRKTNKALRKAAKQRFYNEGDEDGQE